MINELERLGVREVSHGWRRRGGENVGHEDAPPIEAIEKMFGSMNSRNCVQCLYANTEAIHLHFMACENTCVITGIKLDTSVNPISLDRKLDSYPYSREHCQQNPHKRNYIQFY